MTCKIYFWNFFFKYETLRTTTSLIKVIDPIWSYIFSEHTTMLPMHEKLVPMNC